MRAGPAKRTRRSTHPNLIGLRRHRRELQESSCGPGFRERRVLRDISVSRSIIPRQRLNPLHRLRRICAPAAGGVYIAFTRILLFRQIRDEHRSDVGRPLYRMVSSVRTPSSTRISVDALHRHWPPARREVRIEHREPIGISVRGAGESNTCSRSRRCPDVSPASIPARCRSSGRSSDRMVMGVDDVAYELVRRNLPIASSTARDRSR